MNKDEKELIREKEAEEALKQYKQQKKDFIEQDLNFSFLDILKPKLKYPFTKLLLKAITFYQNEKIEYLHKKNIKIPKGRRVIYANTHRFKPDFEKITIGTRRASFIVASDFKKFYKTINGWYFNTRPTIFVDPDSEEDKRNTFLMMVKYLKAGLDGMIFPEAVWDLSENRIVLDTFLGTVEAALVTNSVIVCTAIERYKKKYVINRKGYFDPMPIVKKYTHKDFNDLDESDENDRKIRKAILLEANTIMRNTLASLLMEIFKEKNQVEYRKDIPDDYWEKFVEDLTKELPGYRMKDNETQQFQNPKILEQKAVEKSLYQDVYQKPNENNFFMGMSNERYQKYLEIKQGLKQIEENLLKFREQQEEILPIEERLALYKKRKRD